MDQPDESFTLIQPDHSAAPWRLLQDGECLITAAVDHVQMRDARNRHGTEQHERGCQPASVRTDEQQVAISAVPAQRFDALPIRIVDLPDDSLECSGLIKRQS